MLTLHPDQRDLMEAASAAFRAGKKRVGIQAPTGFGKTVLTGEMFRSAAGRGFRSILIVHRRELLGQASRAFTANGVEHGMIAARVAPNPARLVQIATIGALARRVHTIERPRFAAFDECHHLPAPGWSSIQSAFEGAFQIGLSASWVRFDGQGLRDHFDCLVCGPAVRALQRRGHLSPGRHLAPQSSLDLTGIRTRLGDYHRGDLTAAVDRSSINGESVNAYLRFAEGKRTPVFATSIEQSEQVVDAFLAAGIPAEHVDGKTPASERDAAIARFERSETLVLSNVELFGEGFDVPAIEAVIMLRPTKSLALFLQMAGRALRPAPNKQFALIIDLVGNYQRHGLAEDDRKWSLDAQPAEPENHSGRLLVCAACDMVAEHKGFCPACGVPPKPCRRDEVELWLELVRQPGLAGRLRSMADTRFSDGLTTSKSCGSLHLRLDSRAAWRGTARWNVRVGFGMGKLISLCDRRLSRREVHWRRHGRDVVHAFPGTRHLRMIDNVAAHMASLNDDVAMHDFLVFHFEVEERRLIAHGVADPEIDRYIFETAREIWSRLRNIREGVA